MTRRLTALASLVAAAALASGCGGATPSSHALPPSGTVKKPDASASFTVVYPTNLVRAHASQRSPRFIDPYGSPILLVTSVDALYGAGFSTQTCVLVNPGTDGTQKITIPVYSDGGAISIVEQSGGSVASDGVSCGATSGVLLAQTWNPSPSYYLTANQILYSAFTPGSDVAGPAGAPTPSPVPTPTPSVTPIATPTPTAPQIIFSTPLTLQPVIAKIIYESSSAASYGYATLPANTTTPMPLTGAGSVNYCGGDTVTFLAADANGVSVGANALPTPAPNPSGSPTPTPNPTPAAYSGFMPVAFSGFNVAAGSARPGSQPGTVSVGAFTTAGFTVTARDVFGDAITTNVTVGPCAG